MSLKYRTAKRRALLTRAIRDTFGVQLQSVHANGTRCVTALLSLHATVVSILTEFVVSTAFIFFNRSGRLRSPLHKRCHLSVRMPVLLKRARMQRFPLQTEQGTDVGNSFFRQAFDTLSKARQGRVGRTNGACRTMLIFRSDCSRPSVWPPRTPS